MGFGEWVCVHAPRRAKRTGGGLLTREGPGAGRRCAAPHSSVCVGGWLLLYCCCCGCWCCDATAVTVLDGVATWQTVLREELNWVSGVGVWLSGSRSRHIQSSAHTGDAWCCGGRASSFFSGAAAVRESPACLPACVVCTNVSVPMDPVAQRRLAITQRHLFPEGEDSLLAGEFASLHAADVSATATAPLDLKSLAAATVRARRAVGRYSFMKRARGSCICSAWACVRACD